MIIENLHFLYTSTETEKKSCQRCGTTEGSLKLYNRYEKGPRSFLSNGTQTCPMTQPSALSSSSEPLPKMNWCTCSENTYLTNVHRSPKLHRAQKSINKRNTRVDRCDGLLFSNEKEKTTENYNRDGSPNVMTMNKIMNKQNWNRLRESESEQLAARGDGGGGTGWRRWWRHWEVQISSSRTVMGMWWSIGKRVTDTVIITYGASWALEILRTLCKVCVHLKPK